MNKINDGFNSDIQTETTDEELYDFLCDMFDFLSRPITGKDLDTSKLLKTPHGYVNISNSRYFATIEEYEAELKATRGKWKDKN